MATTQQETRDAGVQQAEACAPGHGHHWLIESPNGPTSMGVCRICGAEREFKNSVQITSWESDGSHASRNQALAGS
ncbi:MAG: hypothetical protein OXI25_03320 [Chloroflexota bacterium]|nr:hypothetical protein [Chloroflexota bacterium]